MSVVQPRMQVHEDLAALLSRKLTLDPAAEPPAPPGQFTTEEEEQPKMVYSSQHYNHSAHVARPPQQSQPQSGQLGQQESQQQQQMQRPASESPQPELQPENQTTKEMLVQLGVDMSIITPAQLLLFKTADDEQRMRLLLTWRVVAPTYSNTKMTDEETMARLMWDRGQQQEALSEYLMLCLEKKCRREMERAASSGGAIDTATAMSLDGTPVATGLASRSEPDPTHEADRILAKAYMEPYMSMGYEEIARREYMVSNQQYQQHYQQLLHQQDQQDKLQRQEQLQQQGYNPAIDPVYRSTHVIDWVQQQEAIDMENQYGALMAMRDSD